MNMIFINVMIHNIFLFTLNSNGRSEVQKFDRKRSRMYTYIKNDYNFYEISNDDEGSCCYINKIDTNESWIIEKNLKYSLKGFTDGTLIGETNYGEFTVRKIVVLEMK